MGGLLILVGALVALVVGAMDLVVGRPLGSVNAWSESIVLFVVGGLALFFAYLGQHNWRDHALTSGILLVVVALLGWVVLGLGSNLVALVGAIFVFLSGVLFLIEPTRKVVHDVATAA